MKSSGQKAGFSIALMISVIIAAGVGVDWWDARQSRLLPNPVDVLQADDVAMKRMMDDHERLKKENERLKTEMALQTIQNDQLRKQVEELLQKSAGVPLLDVVKDDKTNED